MNASVSSEIRQKFFRAATLHTEPLKDIDNRLEPMLNQDWVKWAALRCSPSLIFGRWENLCSLDWDNL